MSSIGKITLGIAIIAMIVSTGGAFQVNVGGNHTVENGVYFENGQEMHVVKDVSLLVQCKVGQGSLNSSFNITAEAMEHMNITI